MSPLLMRRLLLLVLTSCLIGLTSSQAHSDEPRALPVDPSALATPPSPTPAPIAPPPLAMPAYFDVVTFQVRDGGDSYQIVTTIGPNQVRVDQPTDGYSIIYDPQTDHYTGLEHRNYTYWEFSWPEVKAAVSNTKRYAEHLRDLSSEGVSGYDQSAGATTNADDGSSSISIGSDNSGYVWKSTPDRKTIAGLDCQRWVGETVSGESVDAWCYSGSLPKIDAAIAQLRKINEPIALVPVRNLVPPLIFTFYDALVKGGSTPVLISWGGEQDRSHFAFISAKTRAPKLDLFAVPKAYVKTTLITMDGITNPVSETGGADRQKRAGGGAGF